MRKRYQHLEQKFARLYHRNSLSTSETGSDVNHDEESDSTNKRKTASIVPIPDVPQNSLITATAHLLTRLKERLLVPEHDLESISLAVCRGLQECSSSSREYQQPASGMVIQAAAGGGKTTLLNTFLEHYRHGSNRCLYVSGRDVKGKDR